MAGFLLWLSITNIMIEVSKSLQHTGYYLINWYDLLYKGIVPSHCRLMTRHLGATLFKLRLHQIHKSHVAASMHHDTWGLTQSHCLLTYWRPDSSHHNKLALGGYQLLLSTIQGTKLFIHYIEGYISQLVKHKALNLVDVDSSPMMGVISYDVIFIEVYVKVPAHYCIITRPLGATLVEIFMRIRKL